MTNKQFTILIVEDDNKLRKELTIFLENNAYKIKTITDFSDTTNTILNTKYDLLLLDINLPNINGEIICKEIRKQNTLPIIIITSRNNDLDELLSINYGADDFITKPFNTQILLARIERLLERTNNIQEKLQYKDSIIDITKSTITKGTKQIELSKNEIKILTYMLKNKDKIVPREDIMDNLWGKEIFIDDNTLTVNINRLRKKLAQLGYKETILTKRSQGYILQ